MPRIRSIKPEFPQSESMGRVGREARLCFILLWTLADDAGRLRGSSQMLASLLFPYDEDARTLIDVWLSELQREKCVLRYEVDGDTYLQVINWQTHQRIDKPTVSKIPVAKRIRERSKSPREDDKSIPRRKGSKEGIKGREGNKPTPPALPAGVPQETWGAFLEHRKRLDKPMTVYAQTLALAKLEKLRGQGNDPVRVIQQSIEEGWRGLFGLSGKGPAREHARQSVANSIYGVTDGNDKADEPTDITSEARRVG